MKENVNSSFVDFVPALRRNNERCQHLYTHLFINHLVIASHDSGDKRNLFIPQEFIFLKLIMPWSTASDSLMMSGKYCPFHI